MSEKDDNFLARWSRRKREVAEETQPEPSPPRGERVAPKGLGEGASGVEFDAGSPSPGPSPQGGGEHEQPLPRLEDLTAESDLSAFLRKGVPEALKKAALRRMWSLDPAIRDFVGPAEYAYDYNDPASIPGFGGAGGLASALKSGLPRFSNSLRQIGEDSKLGQTRAGERPAPADDAPARPESDPDLHSVAIGGPAAPLQAEERQAPELEAPRKDRAGAPAAEKDVEPIARRHGGALPR